jgi:hypothetical protein
MQGYGGEDEFLGYQLRQAGIRIVFAEAARSEHIDDVSIGRYKRKILEANRGGYLTLMRRIPDFFVGTGAAFLQPMRPRHDSMRVLLAKAGTRLVLNPVTTMLLEMWVRATDRVSFLYLPWVCRALVGGWSLAGQRSIDGRRRLVDYV